LRRCGWFGFRRDRAEPVTGALHRGGMHCGLGLHPFGLHAQKRANAAVGLAHHAGGLSGTAPGLVGLQPRLGHGTQRLAGAELGSHDQHRNFSFGGVFGQQVSDGGHGPFVTTSASFGCVVERRRKESAEVGVDLAGEQI
jgi:hypothetical protein